VLVGKACQAQFHPAVDWPHTPLLVDPKVVSLPSAVSFIVHFDGN